MSTRYTVGAASIGVNDAAVVRALDRVSDGAATQFIDTTSTALTEVSRGAVARWPVNTGESRRSFAVRAYSTDTLLRVGLENDARQRGRGYAWYVRYSVRTKASLRADVEKAVARGTSPEAQAAIRRYISPRILGKNGQRGAPDSALAGKNVWAMFVRRPATKAKDEIVATLREQIANLARGA